jgi:hypothetical protein
MSLLFKGVMNLICWWVVVDMYAKCGGIEDAQRVFNKCPHTMLSLGMQCLQDMPFMDMLSRLLN